MNRTLDLDGAISGLVLRPIPNRICYIHISLWHNYVPGAYLASHPAHGAFIIQHFQTYIYYQNFAPDPVGLKILVSQNPIGVFDHFNKPWWTKGRCSMVCTCTVPHAIWFPKKTLGWLNVSARSLGRIQYNSPWSCRLEAPIFSTTHCPWVWN